MFTTCPKCALSLAITAADLRIGQGYVRCGRCASVFNALVGLADDGETPAAAAAAAVADADVDTQESQILVESSLEGEPGTGTFETIVLEGDSYLQTTEVVAADEVDQQLQEMADRIEAANSEPAASDPVDAIPLKDDGDVEVTETRERAPAAWVFAEAPQLPEPDGGEFDDEAAARARLLRNLTGLGCGVLLLLLAAQLVHHYRAPLAALPGIGAPLTALYAALGASLEPHWELSAYELRQLGTGADPAVPDGLILRASLRNTSNTPRPLPLLRVVSSDRFGNAIAKRDYAPADYLLAPGVQYLRADQRVDAAVHVRTQNGAALGFVFDVCLPAQNRALRCGDDDPFL